MLRITHRTRIVVWAVLLVLLIGCQPAAETTTPAVDPEEQATAEAPPTSTPTVEPNPTTSPAPAEETPTATALDHVMSD